ncbi:putative membrane protein [Nonomuraea polychroma]|uniref:Putative membrane protein n=1 Tax=Nonomuraea polychroma TaxID=46176 RepID=A0A438M0N2_9ACTN|nr:PH domain-containing protein [Nonomuraea polychroma]RVX39355.1 putative membrane protein [Nonomuraea polychroma]
MSEISVRREQDAGWGQDWQRPARRSLGASAVKSSAFAVPAVLGLVRFLTTRDWPVAGVVAVCAGAAVLIVAGVLAYDVIRLRTTRWRLTDDRLELRSGIAVRQRRSIPRDRVRSVDLRADPVLRAFGLTVVKVGTGERSAEDDELRLDPLTRHDAETLRRTLLRGAVAGPQVDAPLAELKWSWIRYAPLSVWTFTGAAVVLGLAYKGLNTIGVKVLTTEVAEGLWSWVTARPVVTVPLLLVANAAVGALGAGLLFAESWGRYRLEREPGRLRLRRGLLTARSLTMEERRLRGVEISEPLLLRLGGGARVKAIATGLGKAGENETEDVAALTPPLPRAVAGRLAAEIARTNLPAPASPRPSTTPGPGTASELGTGAGVGSGLAAHPPAARRRRIGRALVTVLVLAAGAAAVSSLVPWAWVRAWVWAAPAVALPLGLWLAAESARSLGHALGGRHLITRTGSVVRRTVALDRAGISGWTITESLFQRRHGLLTVSATTAAGDGRYDVVDVGRGDGLDLASRAVPGLLEPFLDRSARNT